MNKEHVHNFVAEKYNRQLLDKKYIGSQKYQMATLEQEEVLIFCTACGEHKELTEVRDKGVDTE